MNRWSSFSKESFGGFLKELPQGGKPGKIPGEISEVNLGRFSKGIPDEITEYVFWKFSKGILGGFLDGMSRGICEENSSGDPEELYGGIAFSYERNGFLKDFL